MTVTPRKVSIVLGLLDQPKPEPTVRTDGTVERDLCPPPALSLLLFLVTETRLPATLQSVLVGVGLSPAATGARPHCHWWVGTRRGLGLVKKGKLGRVKQLLIVH